MTPMLQLLLDGLAKLTDDEYAWACAQISQAFWRDHTADCLDNMVTQATLRVGQ
jgi:hypothetical protein